MVPDCRDPVADTPPGLRSFDQTKFGKTRLVPFGPRIASVLAAYRATAERRRGPLSADMPFFSFTRRGAINPCTITQTFHHLVPRLQLVIPDGVASPRLHDLRHHAGSRIMPRSAWERCL